MNGNTVRSGHRRIWIYFNVKKRTDGERCFIDGFSERIYRGYGAGFGPHMFTVCQSFF